MLKTLMRIGYRTLSAQLRSAQHVLSTPHADQAAIVSAATPRRFRPHRMHRIDAAYC